MKCFYHTDVDGKCAGAIVKKWWDSELRLMQDGVTADMSEFIGIDYKDNFPFERILPNEEIIIVDFSLQKPGEFERLLGITQNIIWIDHHKTAIEKHLDMASLKGIRDISKAGCELAWLFFFPATQMPTVVQYAGRYDVWDFSELGEVLNEFQAGIRLQEHDPESSIWVPLLREYDNAPRNKWECQDGETASIFLSNLLTEGKIALKFRTNMYVSLVRAFSFYASFEGYRAICCNAGSVSSQLFDSIPKGTYNLMMPFVFDGNKWTVSIYSTNKDIDCSELAKKYGGGGHRGAAGFQCKELPLKAME